MAWRLRLGTGDTKRGTLIGIDRFGNKYFENMEEELPRMLKRACVLGRLAAKSRIVRTRWVDYKNSEYEP